MRAALATLLITAAGICCTGAATADELTKDQWTAIRESNSNKNDKMKWTLTQALLDAAKIEGFNSSTKTELRPMSNASSVLKSFKSRNEGANSDADADVDVTSPEKLAEPPSKAIRREPLQCASSETADDNETEVCGSDTVAVRPGIHISVWITVYKVLTCAGNAGDWAAT
jgi:hypothetical protein